MQVIESAMRRSRTVVMSLAVIIVAGVMTYVGVPKEAEPDIKIPMIYVHMTHDGISPEDAERLLVRPMEQEIRTIEGIEELTADAYEGGASVTIRFDAGTNVDIALQDARAKVDAAKAKLPAETEEPRVSEIKFSRFSPMLILNLAGEVPERTLTTIARDLKEKIEGVTGVLEVTLVGVREELMEIVVDPRAMESYGLDQSQIFSLVDRNNRLVAAGALHTSEGRFPVKVPGVFETAADLLEMPIKVVDDRIVQFRDVAEVRRTYKDAESVARLNGNPALAIEVVQRSGANIIGTVGEVKTLIEAERQNWPPGIEIVASRDKSKDVNRMLSSLQNSVISAVLLVFIIIIGILGIRAAGLVGVAIPGSFLLGILTIAAFGITINMMVLFALIMAVGLLVDGAIVVTELADRRMAEGMEKRDAYLSAARRMSWPIIASTCTTLAAFVPLAFWPNEIGEFMKFLPITLIAVLSASLLMALLFVPTLGSIFGASGTMSEQARRDLTVAETGDLEQISGMTGKYIQFLKRSLKRPWINVATVTGLLILTYSAFFAFGRGVELFPSIEPEFANLEIHARGDLSTEEKDFLVRQVEAYVLDLDEVESVYAKTGGSGQGAAEDQIGMITLNFIEWDERRPANEILAEVRTNTAGLAGISIQTQKAQEGPQQGKPVSIQLSSRFPDILTDATRKVREALENIDGVYNVDDTRPLPGIEWRIDVDRAEAARFGADITLVGNMIQLVTNGIKVGEYRPDDADDEIDIRVRYPYVDRSLAQIDELRIPTQKGLVPISNFVERVPANKVSTIQRTNMRRTMKVEADVLDDYLDGEIVQQMVEVLPYLEIDPSVAVQFRGGSEDQQEAQAFLGKAMMIAVSIMAIILVTQFNNLFQALLILTAVVFSTGGVLLGHLVMDKPFGTVMSGIGVITLAGIVVNNNIVFIDTFNVLKNRGSIAYEAILRTCALRLRPVLLTTVTTILGLMPMVFAVDIDLINRDISVGAPATQYFSQLSSSVAGGLAFATILTLLLTPSLLMIQANASAWFADRKNRRSDQAITTHSCQQDAAKN
ncbi:MAG: efflux RND transporter permease subunit [Pseudomonadota bacterium]|nr:efflux RND transporter permease subunit [Pseudomonadota bacterium]